MSNITNYSFLFQSMFGGTKTTWGTGGALPGVFQFSQLNSGSIQSQLKAAGIDTSSKQYKAVIQQMTKNGCTGNMFTNVQAIKNLMKQYNSNGEYVNPVNGLTGLEVTDATGDSYKKIIDIPESSKDEMFEQTKKEFLQENGVHNGDTTKRSDVYTNMYWKVSKNDRLSAGYTMQQYERAYRNAFYAAAREADPSWEIGKPVPSGALDGITRESVESQLVKSGNTLVKRSSVSGGSIDLQV
ncbi:MAG: DUF3879 family protein [Lachnospiraceae bacterium]|nr:DUF3879 family protein [Lachnospiraceae bacterium]MBD5548710.1 DUF3879 family protein [Lachnospiraceae bacterium]